MFGQKIADTRKARGLSRAQLAAACGSSERTIANYENEKRQPSPDMLAVICDALDVSADYLLGRTDAPQILHYAGVDPERVAAVAGLCGRCFDLAALDAGADYERDALPVYAEILDALRRLVTETDELYNDVKEKYRLFTPGALSFTERASLSAAAMSGDPAAIEITTGERAFDSKLQNRVEKTGAYIFSLLSEGLFNALRAKPGADVPQLAHIVHTGGSSDK